MAMDDNEVPEIQVGQIYKACEFGRPPAVKVTKVEEDRVTFLWLTSSLTPKGSGSAPRKRFLKITNGDEPLKD